MSDRGEDADIGWGIELEFDSITYAIKNQITPGAPERESVEKTHSQSPLRRKEFIPGLIDEGTVAFTINFKPGEEIDMAGDPDDLLVTFPDGTTYEWAAAFCTKFARTSPIAEVMTAEVEFKVGEAPTITPA